MVKNITKDICYVGVDDEDIVLFEHQYDIRPIGISYNSYVIFDKKITIMDTVDARCTEEWLKNIKVTLGDEKPYYLVVSHMEPDHAANIRVLCDMYPEMKLIGNARTFTIIDQFFGAEFLIAERRETVQDGDTISLDTHNLTFIFAPMVHWPEVMVSYDSKDKVLFSADGFGRFGTLKKTANALWAPQARRYFWNIVGKYCAQIETLLKKASALDIEIICPLHGPVLSENIEEYIKLYELWSSREPENPDAVFIAHASIYGNTAKACEKLADILRDAGLNVTICDLATSDMSIAVMGAFYAGKIIVASASYDGGLFPVMADFLHHLSYKDFQKRKVGIIENGSWAPVAGRKMEEILAKMKDIEIYDTKVTIKSSLNSESEAKLYELANEIIGKV